MNEMVASAYDNITNHSKHATYNIIHIMLGFKSHYVIRTVDRIMDFGRHILKFDLHLRATSFLKTYF